MMSSQDLEFATPMMLQYMELKQQYPECILLFRLGDFYEMFLEDAKIGAEVLGITLTSRARGKDGRIPMAGVPYHAVDTYLNKLVQSGYKVAICDQVSEPDGRNLVDRRVIRIITPGTVIDEKSLDRKEHNYLLSVELENNQLGVAATDLSTGDFFANQFEVNDEVTVEKLLSEVVQQLHPSECIVTPQLAKTSPLQATFTSFPNLIISPFSGWPESAKQAKRILSQQSQGEVATGYETLSGSQVITAVAGVVRYLQHTQKTEIHHLHRLQPLEIGNYLRMNRSTVMNLELFQTLREGQKKGCLFTVIDETHTAMGGRLLKQWLSKPLIEKMTIDERLRSVEFFLQHPELRSQIRELLKKIPDIERITSRLSLNIGSPRDLKTLADALNVVHEVQRLGRSMSSSKPTLFQKFFTSTDPSLEKIISVINSTLVDNPPVDPRQGNLIQTGIEKELDSLRATVQHSRSWIAQLEETERKRTGIPSLKIKFNQVFGFYIEISNANLHLIPENYARKQTLVNAERFITPELKEHEDIILHAEEKTNKIEYQIFLKTVQEAMLLVSHIQAAAHDIALLDCIVGFAELAEKNQYIKPEVIEAGELIITQGRHPVIEHIIGRHQFVPNDLCMDTQSSQLLIITGPNMAGKSVLMRQTALITLMAHIGSFVPAQTAQIPLTDQIFVRSGAADMITAGLSTFMVEMVETASILRQATARSLVIMDEIGRGTSTYDGISIAWSVAEYLITNWLNTSTSASASRTDLKGGPKTLFATHYHELQQLEEKWPNKIRNVHMAVTEHQGKPVFLYTLKDGGASHSFGIAVAELAEIPQQVIHHAQVLLQELEKGGKALEEQERGQESSKNSQQRVVQTVAPTSSLLTDLQAVDLSHTTPLDALNILASWQKKFAATQIDNQTRQKKKKDA
jgi:DNA mismatch repair protein MutS